MQKKNKTQKDKGHDYKIQIHKHINPNIQEEASKYTKRESRKKRKKGRKS